jgi:hypothetical protein
MKPPRPSVLMSSVARRLAAALLPIALLWLAVAWALSSGAPGA